MKKLIIIGIITCIAVITGALYYYNIRALPLIVEGKEFSQFYLNDELIDESTVVEKLQEVFLKYETKIKLFYNPFPMNEEEYDYRIDYYMEGNPRHIVIGSEIFVYSGSQDKVYLIINEESFRDEIIDIIGGR